MVPSGAVTVIPEQSWSNAQTDTSLDGVSFATSGTSFTKLTLRNGWFIGGSGVAGPGARSISGIVHLRGLISTTGSNAVPFRLPAGLRPDHMVYVPAACAAATTGAWTSTRAGMCRWRPRAGSPR